jgi:hypothetical protein
VAIVQAPFYLTSRCGALVDRTTHGPVIHATVSHFDEMFQNRWRMT